MRAGARRSPSACCSISPPSPIAKTRRCSGGFCAAMRRMSRRRRIRGSTGSSSMRCAISAISCGLARPIARPTRSSARRLREALAMCSPACRADASAEDIQTALYDIARPIPRYQDLKAKGATPERPGVSNEWFNMLYQVLLGESRGPRFGSFVALYGIAETRQLIADALGGRTDPPPCRISRRAERQGRVTRVIAKRRQQSRELDCFMSAMTRASLMPCLMREQGRDISPRRPAAEADQARRERRSRRTR